MGEDQDGGDSNESGGGVGINVHVNANLDGLKHLKHFQPLLSEVLGVVVGGTTAVWDLVVRKRQARDGAHVRAIETASDTRVRILERLGDRAVAALDGDLSPELAPDPEGIIASLQVGGLRLSADEEFLLYQALESQQRKQRNLLGVGQQAVLALPGTAEREGLDEGSRRTGPVDPDWRQRFRSAAGDVSSEEMQEVWGNVLAQEVVTPGSVSVRTLRVLADLSRREMELFTCAVPYLAFDGGAVLSGDDVMSPCGVDGDGMLGLISAGLIVPDLRFWKPTTNQVALGSVTVEGERAPFLAGVGVHSISREGRELHGVVRALAGPTVPEVAKAILLASGIFVA